MQQQHLLDYGRQTRRGLLLPVVFHATCAMAFMICVASMVAQAAGWGKPLMQSLDASMRPLETRYGLQWGHYYATFATVIRITIWFPIVWLSLFVGRIVASRLRSRRPVAA